ncbi:MAG: hypothetical protein QNK71_09685, partial [Amylibacter sp.]
VCARCGMISFVSAIYCETRSAVRGCSIDISLIFLNPLININKLLSKTYIILKAIISLVIIALG